MAEAEALEFRRSEFSKAVSLYKGLLSRSHDRQVLAWITNRIARLEVKKRNYKRAIALYRSIGKDAGGLLTESGRPLELVAGLELLDCLRADGNYAGFFEESLATYSRLQKNPWSLNGERLDLYADMIKTKIDDVLLEKYSVLPPKDYLRTVKEYQSLLESQLSAWRLARIVEVEILRELRRELKSPTSADLPVHQAAIEFEG